MTRMVAAVLLTAILGTALVAPVSGDGQTIVPSCEAVRSPAPGFTERQWEMLWGLAPGSPFCADFSGISLDLPIDSPKYRPQCNLFEYLQGRALVALLHC